MDTDDSIYTVTKSDYYAYRDGKLVPIPNADIIAHGDTFIVTNGNMDPIPNVHQQPNGNAIRANRDDDSGEKRHADSSEHGRIVGGHSEMAERED